MKSDSRKLPGFTFAYFGALRRSSRVVTSGARKRTTIQNLERGKDFRKIALKRQNKNKSKAAGTGAVHLKFIAKNIPRSAVAV